MGDSPVAAIRRSLETMLGMRPWYIETATSSKKKPARKMFIGDPATVNSGVSALKVWLLLTSTAAFATAVNAPKSMAGHWTCSEAAGLNFRWPARLYITVTATSNSSST